MRCHALADIGDAFADIFDFVADKLELLSGNAAKLFGFLLQAVKLLSCLSNLPLQRSLLFDRLIGIAGLLQLLEDFLLLLQFLTGIGNCLFEVVLLLGEQCSVARIQLQQFVHILERSLSLPERAIDLFHRFHQAGRIAV